MSEMKITRFDSLDGNPEGYVKTTEVSVKIDPIIKNIIIELIYNKITEVEENNFEPAFIVLSRKAYASLVAHIREKGYVSGVDGQYPNAVYGIPIVMAGDTPLDVRVVANARNEFLYGVSGDSVQKSISDNRFGVET